jgi:hypothetical protein
MTRHESVEEVGHLVGLYPRMSQENIDFWHETFLRYPRSAVHSAVLRFAEFNGDFVDRPGLLAAIQDEIGRPDAPSRLDAARQQSQSCRDAEDHERAAARATWKQVDAMIAKIPDDELAILKNLAIEGYSLLNEYGRGFLRTLDPRKSSMLKRLIYAQCSPAS